MCASDRFPDPLTPALLWETSAKQRLAKPNFEGLIGSWPISNELMMFVLVFTLHIRRLKLATTDIAKGEGLTSTTKIIIKIILPEEFTDFI